jgi:hypothetical protein
MYETYNLENIIPFTKKEKNSLKNREKMFRSSLVKCGYGLGTKRVVVIARKLLQEDENSAPKIIGRFSKFIFPC